MRYNAPSSTYSETDKEHARVEICTVSIYPMDRMEDKNILCRWKNLRTLVKIDTRRIHVSENGREETQTRYYISDEDFQYSRYYGELARGH